MPTPKITELASLQAATQFILEQHSKLDYSWGNLRAAKRISLHQFVSQMKKFLLLFYDW